MNDCIVMLNRLPFWISLLLGVIGGLTSTTSFGQSPKPIPMVQDSFFKAGNVRFTIPLKGGRSVIGGRFSSVNAVPQSNLAILNADGTLDRSWRPQVGEVTSMAVVDGEVYVCVEGPLFFSSQIQRIPIEGDGTRDTGWNPDLKQLVGAAFYRVNQLLVAGEHVYPIAQRFDARGRASSLLLGRFFRAGTGAFDKAWSRKTLGQKPVFQTQLVADDTHIYAATTPVSGALTAVRFDLKTGKPDKRWRVNAGKNGLLAGLEVDDNFVYLLGRGFSFSRTVAGIGIARFGKVKPIRDLSWPEASVRDRGYVAADADADSVVLLEIEEEVSGDVLLFNHSIVRILTGAENAAGTADYKVPLPGKLDRNYTSLSLSLDGDLFVNSISGSVLRARAENGLLDDQYAPRIVLPGDINDVIALETGGLLVCGAFDFVGDFPIPGVAKFDNKGVVDKGWVPLTFGDVSKMNVVGNMVYLQGSLGFGSTFKQLARVSLAAPGAFDPLWDPEVRIEPTAFVFVAAGFFTDNAVFIVTSKDPASGSERDRVSFLRRIPYAGNGTPDPTWDIQFPGFAPEFFLEKDFLYGEEFRYAINGGGVRDPNWRLADYPGFSFGATSDAQYFYLSASRIDRYLLNGGGVRDTQWQPPEDLGVAQSILSVGDHIYVVANNVAGEARDKVEVSITRLDSSGQQDTDFTTVLGIQTANFDLSPRWVSALGDAPILGGNLASFPGATGATPFLFSSLPPPQLTRSDLRIFLSLDDAEALGIILFQVNAIQGGTLAIGGEPVLAGDFISLADGRLGLDFTPDPLFPGQRLARFASAFSDEIGQTGSPATIDLTGTVAPRPQVRMEATELVVREGSAAARVQVDKTGAAGGAVTVSFQLVEGTALLGTHFTAPVSATLDFPAGEGSGFIEVPLLDDIIFTGDKNLVVTLTSVSGNGILLQPSSTVVTIVEDDPISQVGSLLIRPPLSALPLRNASLRVVFNAPLGAWRLLGEQTWHPSGFTAVGLTRGNYFVEYRQVNGFLAPPNRPVPLDFGDLTEVAVDYAVLPGDLRGGISVSILPSGVANAEPESRGQWRVIGESTWRNSDDVFEDLPLGVYDIEFRPVAGFDAPAPQSVNVLGSAVYGISAVYLVSDNAVGEAPTAQSLLAVQSEPLGFMGQIQTSVGYGTGTAVTPRSVITVAHAVFDDETLAYVTEARWFHQRSRGEFEPPPQFARGWYIFGGYAMQRAEDVTSLGGGSGISTPESQKLDVAVLWFLNPCARGSFSGYLLTDMNNNWLLANRRRVLAGYPASGVAETALGIPHSTLPDTAVPMMQVNESVYQTAAVRGFPGMSGGPLFVDTDNTFYPAAIYLGGTAQTLVRVIDAGVVDLINRSDISANGGANNVNGGAPIAIIPGLTTSQFAPTVLGCTLSPASAINAGASWRVAGETAFRSSGVRLNRLQGTYRIEFRPVAGFATPPTQVVTLTTGQSVNVRATYIPGVRITTTMDPAEGGTAPSGDFPINSEVTLLARPAANFIFESWQDENGMVLSRSSRLTLVASGPRSLTARFVPGSFVRYAGTYGGLHVDGTDADGIASFVITGNGKFTGSLIIQGERFSLKGTLDERGEFSGALGSRGSILLALDRTSNVGVLRGSVFGRGEVSGFEAAQSPYTATTAVPAERVGDYTVLLPPENAADPTRPQGTGYATLKFSAAGKVTLIGVMGDTVRFSSTSQILSGVDGDQLPVFASLLRGKGLVVGTLVFREHPGVSAADGPLRWVRPAAERDKLYPAGFETTIPAVVSRYIAPPVDYTQALLELSGGGVAAFSRPMAISDRFAGTASTDATLRFGITSKTGLFSGSVATPGTGRKLKFNGAIFQATRAGSGLFRDAPESTGMVQISPAE